MGKNGVPELSQIDEWYRAEVSPRCLEILAHDRGKCQRQHQSPLHRRTEAEPYGICRLPRGRDVAESHSPQGNRPGTRRQARTAHGELATQQDESPSHPYQTHLLDQTIISVIGKWVDDETLYQAEIHSEQYCDNFSDAEIKTPYDSICPVCQTTVDKLGNSDQYPSHWLYHYRPNKEDSSAASRLPNGEKVPFIIVGGATNCFALGVQNKTGRLGSWKSQKMVRQMAKQHHRSARESRRAKPTLSRKRNKIVAAHLPKEARVSGRRRAGEEVDGPEGECRGNSQPWPKKVNSTEVMVRRGAQALT